MKAYELNCGDVFTMTWSCGCGWVLVRRQLPRLHICLTRPCVAHDYEWHYFRMEEISGTVDVERLDLEMALGRIEE